MNITLLKIMKQLLLLLLALPMLAPAQERSVLVHPCCEGYAFTLKVPVNLRGYTVEYRWYRDNVLIPGTQATLPPGEKIIAYNIPANLAYGDSVVYHFEYRLNDGYPAWTASPDYFVPYAKDLPVASAITGDTVVCPGAVGLVYSVKNAWSDSYDWELPPSWQIMSGWGTSKITVRAGAMAGIIRVTPSNGCGVGTYSELAVDISPNRALTLTHTESSGATSQTLCSGSITEIALELDGPATGRSITWQPRAPAGINVNLNSVPITISGSLTEYGAFSYVIIVTGLASYCPGTAIGTIKHNGVRTGGTTSVAPDLSCRGGVANAGDISVTPYACKGGGVRTAGDISVAPYACVGGGVKTAGSISVRAY